MTDHALGRSAVKRQQSWYQAMWRWHFYAGILFAPVFIILSVTGAIYLFKPQIEDMLYHDMRFTEVKDSRLSLAEQAASVKKKLPESAILSVSQPHEADRTTEFSVQSGEEEGYVHVDPYTGAITGKRFTQSPFDWIKTMHGELYAGKAGNLLVELAASWAIILIVTGAYLFWPRGATHARDIWFPSFRQKGRNSWKQLHGSIAAWSTVGLILIIGSGLAWSGVAGGWINTVATKTNSNFPQYAFGADESVQSTVMTRDIAKDVPWATQQDVVPASAPAKGIPLKVDEVANHAATLGLEPPYRITLPQGEEGVYTLSSLHQEPLKEATIILDQYSGTVLSHVTFADYGLLAKLISLGIGFHEGRLFGLLNQLVGLALCLGLIFITVSSFVLWWKRRDGSRKLRAPKSPTDETVKRTVGLIILAISLTMPLAALSVFAVLLLDFFVFRRIERKREVAA
ncbi:PepSY-associated TM helix domain-containing protein [Exiguobacterium flavidum]|uniref:PepSY-associated TM helix domain-containing protein n=1 Tax=Exiguobacterium flavidum TaxID=2184695 RepID=UPI000DF773D8|nr:PepSY domain-containing protein [Exiguobacterium flavidum]